MDITLLELDLSGAEIAAPFADRSCASRSAAPAEADDHAVGGPSLAVPVVAVLALVGLALLARYLRSGREETVDVDELTA